MKKYLLILTFLFLFIGNVSASTKFYLGERVPNIYIRIIDGDRIGYDATSVIRRENDGAFIYCVDPFIYAKYSVDYDEYNYNNANFNLTDEMLDRMNAIAHLGYGYGNHTDLKWYAITQVAIWKELGIDDVYFMDGKDGNRIESYNSELDELKNLVDEYYRLPSFSNQTFKYTINNSYEIEDLNNVIQNYEVVSSNIDYKIADNKLFINTSDIGNYEISFTKKNPVDRDYLLYNLGGAQPLLYPGKINDIEFKINIEVKDGNITINKFDSEGINRTFATLEGAIYGIYEDDILIDELVTDVNGQIEIKNLKLGKYYVKELTPSKGYNLDENIYEVDLTHEKNEFIINSYERIISGYLNVNKYYGEENNYMLEDSARFELFDTNNNLIGEYKTLNGKIEEKLDYGDYYLIQKSGKEGYSFVDRLNLSIKESKKYSYNLYDNVLIVDVPNTGIKKGFNKYGLVFIISGILIIFKQLKNLLI